MTVIKSFIKVLFGIVIVIGIPLLFLLPDAPIKYTWLWMIVYLPILLTIMTKAGMGQSEDKHVE